MPMRIYYLKNAPLHCERCGKDLKAVSSIKFKHTTEYIGQKAKAHHEYFKCLFCGKFQPITRKDLKWKIQEQIQSYPDKQTTIPEFLRLLNWYFATSEVMESGDYRYEEYQMVSERANKILERNYEEMTQQIDQFYKEHGVEPFKGY